MAVLGDLNVNVKESYQTTGEGVKARGIVLTICVEAKALSWLQRSCNNISNLTCHHALRPLQCMNTSHKTLKSKDLGSPLKLQASFIRKTRKPERLDDGDDLPFSISKVRISRFVFQNMRTRPWREHKAC